MKHLLCTRHCSRLGKAEELEEVLPHSQGQTYTFLWEPKAWTGMWVWELKELALHMPGTLFCYRPEINSNEQTKTAVGKAK